MGEIMRQTKMMPVIAAIRPEYLRQVVSIEESSGQQSNPVDGVWQEKDFKSVLSQPDGKGLVVLADSKVAAFAIYCLSPADKIYVANMAVHIGCLRRGFGTLLLEELKKKNKLLEVDVRESNLGAQLFLRQSGFKCVSICRNWYAAPAEHAYKFQYKAAL